MKSKALNIYSRTLSVLFGWGIATWASHHDYAWFGYGHSTPATGGDPLALAIGILVTVLMWKGGDKLTK